MMKRIRTQERESYLAKSKFPRVKNVFPLPNAGAENDEHCNFFITNSR